MGRPLSLRPRLLAVVSFIPPGARVADIGTDHARLPVYLVQRGLASSVMGVDIAEGPLARGRRTLSRHGLEGVIPLLLSDGAAALAPLSVDTVVMAGMGGETIRDMARKSPWLREIRLIVQPQTRQLLLPDWLGEEGFVPAGEARAAEGRRIYRVYCFDGKGPAWRPAERAKG